MKQTRQFVPVISILLSFALAMPVGAQTSMDTHKEAADFYLEIALIQLQNILPMQGAGYTVTDAKMDKYAFTYVYSLTNDAAYQQCKSNLETMKSETLYNIQNSPEAINHFLLPCIDTDRMLRYHYTNSSATDSFDINVTTKEMRELLDISSISDEYRRTTIRNMLELTSESPFSISNTKYSVIIPLNMDLSDSPFKLDDEYFRTTLSEIIMAKEVSAIFPAIALYLGIGLEETLVDKNGSSVLLSISAADLMKVFKASKIMGATPYDSSTPPMPPSYDDLSNDDDLNDEESIPYQLVDVKPKFQGEDANQFTAWVNTQLIYPKESKDHGVQGRVTLQFTVYTDGSIGEIKVLRGADPLLDKEAIRVVSMSPRWAPGEIKGQPVNVTYTFPVIFRLE